MFNDDKSLVSHWSFSASLHQESLQEVQTNKKSQAFNFQAFRPQLK